MHINKDYSIIMRQGRRILRSNNLPESPEHSDSLKKLPFLSPWMLVLGTLTALVGVWLVFGGVAHAYTQEEAVKAVIGEAESEGLTGMEAVACTIHNRHSLHGVYGLHATRVVKHKYSQLTADEAKYAVKQSQDPDFCNYLVHGATGWGNASDMRIFKTHAWFKNCIITAHIGHHWFYTQE